MASKTNTLSTAAEKWSTWAKTRSALAILIAIVVASAAVRIQLFRGYVGLDDAEYVRFAYQIAQGTFQSQEYTGPAVFPLRVGLIFPTAMIIRLFGFSEWAMVLYPLLLSLLTLPLVYICAGSFFSRGAGLIAAGLLGILPQSYEGATKLLPDLPAAFYAAVGVTMIVLLDRSKNMRRSGLLFGGILAGILFGLSWLCKESIFYLAPFCLIFAVMSIQKNGWPSVILWFGVAAGSLGVLLGEMIVYQNLTGDVLFRFHEIERNYRQWENGFFTEGSDFGWKSGENYAEALVRRLFITGPAIMLFEKDFLFLPLFGVIAIFYGWFSRDKSFLIPGIWLGSLLLMFNFASSSMVSYTPLALFSRYLFLLFFPAAILTAGLIYKQVFESQIAMSWINKRIGRCLAIIAAATIFWSGGTQLLYALRHPITWASEVRLLSDVVRPDVPFYSDTLTLRGLEFFRKYPLKNSWVDFEQITSAEEIQTGSLVLVNPLYIEWLNKNAGMWLSKRLGYRQHVFYDAPPPTWKRIWQNGNALLYRVDR